MHRVHFNSGGRIGSSGILFVGLPLAESCINRLDFDTGELNERVVVMGGEITGQPSPHAIPLFPSSDMDDNTFRSLPSEWNGVV